MWSFGDKQLSELTKNIHIKKTTRNPAMQKKDSPSKRFYAIIAEYAASLFHLSANDRPDTYQDDRLAPAYGCKKVQILYSKNVHILYTMQV